MLVAQTEPAEVAELDEDAAVDLHARIRRARGQYTSQHRRTASARVPEQGGRGKARQENKRAAMKAEAFEYALSRVSRRVAALARQSALRLRAERISAAGAGADGRQGGEDRSGEEAHGAAIPGRPGDTVSQAGAAGPRHAHPGYREAASEHHGDRGQAAGEAR